jgi:hypothetical protein
MTIALLPAWPKGLIHTWPAIRLSGSANRRATPSTIGRVARFVARFMA